jgi:hypothetical protein
MGDSVSNALIILAIVVLVFGFIELWKLLADTENLPLDRDHDVTDENDRD